MSWLSGSINPATTSPAADISKITNDLQQLRSVIGGAADTDIPVSFVLPGSTSQAFGYGGITYLQLNGSGNLGLGGGPSLINDGTWSSFQVRGGPGFSANGANTLILSTNMGGSVVSPTRIAASLAATYSQSVGNHIWSTAATGAIGSAIVFNEVARIDPSGNMLVGRTGSSSGGKLEVAGNIVANLPSAAPTLGVNGDMSFQLVSNTSLKILVRGSDGVTRSTSLVLA